MRLALLTLLLACGAAFSSAAQTAAPAQPTRPACPDGAEPLFTGHPFRPLACPPGGKEPSRKSVEPSSTTIHPADGASALKKLDGRWEGLAYFGGTRYEVTLDISDGGRRAVWRAMNYATHIGLPMSFTLKVPGWFSKLRLPRVEASMPALPGRALSGRVWLAPGAATWKYDGRPEFHAVTYQVSGDRLTAAYTDTEPDLGPIGSSLELTRQK